MTAPTLGRGMRGVLLACGPMNLVGAVCFSPPMPAVRAAFGLPEPAPFYLWVISAWVLAFGVAYVHQGWTGRANPAVLGLGAWGKAAFAVPLLGMVLKGEAPAVAGVAALPDLFLAIVFAAWLGRASRRER